MFVKISSGIIHLETYFQYVINAARAYEQTLPPEQRIQTATHRRPSHSGLHSKMQGPKDDETIYKNKMQELQLQTAK